MKKGERRAVKAKCVTCGRVRTVRAMRPYVFTAEEALRIMLHYICSDCAK
jgi:hypothetical protein